jgi:hypothetical protein
MQRATGIKIKRKEKKHYVLEVDTWEDIGWCESCGQTDTWHLQPGTIKIGEM